MHTPVATFLRSHIVWEEECKRWVESQASDLAASSVAIGGLFFGDWLPTLSRAVGVHGHVFGFEPSTENVRMCRATIDANRLHNVHVVNAGISNYTGALRLCLRPAATQAGSRIDGHTPAAPVQQLGGASHVVTDAGEGCAQLEEIPSITLDDTVPWRTSRVSLVLLDVEGHEVPALHGARALIERWKPTLMLEHDHLDYVAPHGYMRHPRLKTCRVKSSAHSKQVALHIYVPEHPV